MKNQIASGIIYRGPSLINGEQIVVIGVYPEKSVNRKTGAVLQTYILRDNENKPSENNKSGDDVAICGNCKHRGTPNNNPNKKTATGRTCYVQFYGVHSVWRKYKSGGYPTLTPDQIISLGRARFIRLGSYGDPLAAPSHVWSNLLSESLGHTAYTHQAQILPSHDTLSRCMVSADSRVQAIDAQSKGFRTFRVIPVKEWQDKQTAALLDSEIICPATNEGGNRTQCRFCKLCNGDICSGAKSIAVVAHGPTRNNVKY